MEKNGLSEKTGTNNAKSGGKIGTEILISHIVLEQGILIRK